MDKIDYFPLECKELIDSIAIIIKEKRLVSHVRQSDVAEKVGVSVSTLRKIEAGDRSVELGTMLHVLWQLGALKDVFTVDSAQLLTSDRSPRRVRLPSLDKEDF
ncbi:MAG: helix-turn-helix transcriptional regulator [Moraxellaceae bacterium]|nr:helix-turn-helix transcriptional regulator [Moraxellaceae bacterium]